MRVEFLHIIDPWHRSSVMVKICKGNYSTEYWILHVFSLIQSKTVQCSVSLQFSLKLSRQFYNMVRN